MLSKIATKAAVAFGIWLLTKEATAKTLKISIDEARRHIRHWNQVEFGNWFNEADILAIIFIESSFRPNAKRHEPHLQDYSIGLMQLLYSTAKDRGLSGGPAGLYDASTNIRLGMRHLKWSYDYLARKMGRPPTQTEWIGSYNAGVGNVYRNGFIPTAYVTKFQIARRNYD